MNTKNRLIQKLLGVAKRHKVLTYPVLALVAIISVISNLFSWSTGAGKRVVAVIMVMVMLVSQSYFLTSSATEAIDDEETALVQQELQQEVMNEYVEAENNKKSVEETATEADSDSTSDDIIEEETIDTVTGDQPVEEQSAQPVDQGGDNNNEINAASVDAADVNEQVSDNSEVVSDYAVDNYNDIENEDMDSKLDPDEDENTIEVYFNYYLDPYKKNGSSTLGGDYKMTVDENGYLQNLTKGGTPINLSDVRNELNGNAAYTNDGLYEFMNVDEWDFENFKYTADKKMKLIDENATYISYSIPCMLKGIKVKFSNNISISDTDTHNLEVGGDDFVKYVAEDDAYIFDINNDSVDVKINETYLFGYKLTKATVTNKGETVIDNEGKQPVKAGDDYVIKYNETISIDTPNSEEYTITLYWEPLVYLVIFSTDAPGENDGGKAAYKSYTYGSGGSLMSFEQCGIDLSTLKSGYNLNGWVDTDGNTYNFGSSIDKGIEKKLFNHYYENKDDIDTDIDRYFGDPSNKYAFMFLNYTPADIELYLSENDVESVMQNNKLIEYVYGVKGNSYQIRAKYDYTDGLGRTSDTNEDLTIAPTASKNIDGVIVSNNDSKTVLSIYTAEDGPKATTYDKNGDFDGINITVNAQSKVNASIKAQRNCTVNVRKHRVIVDTSTIKSEDKEKEYDGTNKVKNEFPKKLGLISKENNNDIKDISVSYNEAVYAPQNENDNEDDGSHAGNHNIILKNYSLDAEYKNFFELTGSDGASVLDTDDENNIIITGGRIAPISIKVQTYIKNEEVKHLIAGQDNPSASNYTLRYYSGNGGLSESAFFSKIQGISNVEEALEAGCFGPKDSINYVLEDKDGNPRTLNTATGTYYVNVPSWAANIDFIPEIPRDGKATIEVTPADATGKYIIDSDNEPTVIDDKNYYYGNEPIIRPKQGSGFDKIIVSTSKLSNIELAEKTGNGGDSQVSIDENMSGQLLYIYLWNSSPTNKAITDPVEETIYYDGTNPIYQGYDINEFEKDGKSYSYRNDGSGDGTGLYFPNIGGVLDFGTYTNKTINVNVSYTDESVGSSGMGKLYYRLVKDITSKPNENYDGFSPLSQNSQYNSADFSESNGKWSATINLTKETAKKVAIDIIAYDKAGNKSDAIRLKPVEGDDYTWLVENEMSIPDEPTIYYSNDSDNRELYVRDTNSGDYSKTADQGKRSIYINTDKSEKNYYNHCQAEIEISDIGPGIKRIEWHDNDNVYVDENSWNKNDEYLVDEDKKGKQVVSYLKSTYPITSQGYHEIYVEVYDNAGNCKKTDIVKFNTDDIDPEIKITNQTEDGWTNSSIINFEAYDIGDNASGIDTVKVINTDGSLMDCNNLKNEGNGHFTGSFDIKNFPDGYYGLEAIDKAGNVFRTGGKVDNYSKSAPSHPEVVFTPADGNYDTWVNYQDGSDTLKWHRTATKVTISYPGEALNGSPVVDSKCPVSVHYGIYKDVAGKAYHDSSFNNKMSDEVTISDDGIFYVDAWAESASNVRCDGNANSSHVDSVDTGAYEVLMIDKTAPSFEEFSSLKADKGIIISYNIIDMVSGVDESSIVLNYNGEKDTTTDVKTEPIDNGYHVSFKASKLGEYKLIVKDIAGNQTETSLVPMSMKVKSVTNITDTSALVGANIFSGTFDIKSGTISYKKYSDQEYKEAESVLVPYPNNDSRDKAVSANLNNLTPDTAYAFKITATSDNGEVLEYEGYFKTLATDQKGTTVPGTAYYSDNIDPANRGTITVGIYDGNICLMAQDISDGDDFVFDSVTDGNYSIIATDGKYSKTVKLSVDDGMIVYPDGLIEIVLSGVNTSVELKTEDTPKVTVDNLESLPTMTNRSAEDKAIIDNNGVVDYKLIVESTSLSENERKQLTDFINSNKLDAVPFAYYDLSIIRTEYDETGNEIKKENIPEMVGESAGVAISVPLGGHANDAGLKMVRIHGKECTILPDVDGQGNNDYTFYSTKFSTYVLIHSVGAPTTEQPTTKQQSTNDQTSVTYTEYTPSTRVQATTQSVPRPAYAYDEPDDDDDEDVKEIKDKKTKPKSSGSTSVGSLTSSGSAKTGDETPIAILFGFMMISVGGIVVLRKKAKSLDGNLN